MGASAVATVESPMAGGETKTSGAVKDAHSESDSLASFSGVLKTK